MKTNIEQVENVIELVKKRADIMLNKEAVLAVSYSKKGSRLIATKVGELQELLERNAKEYGKKILYDMKTGKIKTKQEAELINAYQTALEKIVKQYDDNYKKILALKLKLEGIVMSGEVLQMDTVERRDEYKKAPEYAKEQKLREELEDALRIGDYEVIAEKNKELLEISKQNKATKLDNESKNIRAEIAYIKEEISKCTELQRECEEDRRIAINIITNELLPASNEKSLMIVQKQNWARRSWKKILNRVNGDKRYTNNVLNPLNKKIRDINYKSMPPLRKQLNEKTEELEKTAKEKMEKLQYIDVTKETEQQNKQEKVETKVTEQRYKTIITNARNEIGWRTTKTVERVHIRNKPRTVLHTKKKEQQENELEK